MGVHIKESTIPGGLTPICNNCGVSLCWDISEEEYKKAVDFWEKWICKDCNNGVPLSLTRWKDEYNRIKRRNIES